MQRRYLSAAVVGAALPLFPFFRERRLARGRGATL